MLPRVQGPGCAPSASTGPVRSTEVGQGSAAPPRDDRRRAAFGAYALCAALVHWLSNGRSWSLSNQAETRSWLHCETLARRLQCAATMHQRFLELTTRRRHPARHLADLLSCANLSCGVLSAALAYNERFELALLSLLAGALFDGLDGAAARRFGGTRIGVLADDVADAVTYGLAPAVAVWSFWGGAEGFALASVYLLFTLTRLLHFTLNKAEADPRYFQGVPSTLGGVAVLCAVIALAAEPLLVGGVLGAIAVKMVGFSQRYRHAGRWFASLKRAQQLTGLVIACLALALFTVAPGVVAGLLLCCALSFAMWPSFSAVLRSAGRLRGDCAVSSADDDERSALAA